MLGDDPAEVAGRSSSWSRRDAMSRDADHRGASAGQLRDVTRECVSAAAELGGPVVVGVIASDPTALASQANVAGVDEIVRSRSTRTSSRRTRTPAGGSARSRAQPSSCSPASRSAAWATRPRSPPGWISASHRTSSPCATTERLVAEREMYGAKVQGRARVSGKGDGPADAPAGDLGAGRGLPARRRSPRSSPRPASRSRHREFVEAASGDVDITTADFLLSIGRGVGEKDNIGQFEELAERMGATLASRDRSSTPAGCPRPGRSASRQDRQAQGVPRLRDLGRRPAPRRDEDLGHDHRGQHRPEAAIFNLAHYGAVGDLFDVAEELEKLY